jgi:uncharacterized protein
MARPVSDIAFTPSVKEVQERLGSRESYAQMEENGGRESTVTPELADFLAERDSFYLGTASAGGQPNIQHRGGPKGFLKVIDERTLGFADFGGNHQYITLGNLAENDRAFLFLMDYAHRRRVKVWGRARVVENDPDLIKRLSVPGSRGRPERAILFHVEAWDVNCPQHITRRYSEGEVAQLIQGLRDRIDELENELRTIRAGQPA